MDGSQPRRFEGTGIGLALTRELVELMDGSIELDSQEGLGSTFRVSIPLLNPSNYPPLSDLWLNETEATEENPEEVKWEDQETQGPVILLVEDNDDLRQYLKRKFQSEFRLLMAANGKEGLQLAMEQVPDLVITDVMMPEMDGIEFTHRLKSEITTSHIPVIMLTARDDAETRRSGFQSFPATP